MRATRGGRSCLCLVTDRKLSRRPLAEIVAEAVAAGVDWVQIRERELEGADLLAHADEVAEAARRANPAVRVLVNRRTDVALAAGLDGVHLGFDAAPAAVTRRLLGEGGLLGASTHRPGELSDGEREHLSYAHLAPIFAPLSKAEARPALGLGALTEAARGGLPILAQGGIDAGNARACIEAGAAGVAVTGAVLLAPDPGRAAGALREALGS